MPAFHDLSRLKTTAARAFRCAIGGLLLVGILPAASADEIRLLDALELNWEESPATPLLPASFMDDGGPLAEECLTSCDTPCLAEGCGRVPAPFEPGGGQCSPGQSCGCPQPVGGPIWSWHNPFLTWSDCWVIPRHRHREYCRRQHAFEQDTPVCADEYESCFSRAHCCLQRKFVNFRQGSQYLEGCFPAGFYLLPFIRCAPNIEYHSAPLNPAYAIESAQVDSLEARTADGKEFKPISEVSVDISIPEGALPRDIAKETFSGIAPRMHLPGTGRNWCAVTFQWNASLLNYQPLYFEDVNLERYGYSWGVAQPVVSSTKFMGTVLLMPYLLAARPYHLMSYDLGNARPGSHTPYVHQLPPLSLEGGVMEAATIAGLFLLIP